MVYIINKLDTETQKVVSVGYHNTSVWDAKGLAVRYIRCFILDKDGKEALNTAYELDINELPESEPVNRYSFCLNEEDGTLDVYHLTANMVNGWLSTYRGELTSEKVFSLSITSVDCASFQSAEYIPFQSKDLTIKNNEADKNINGDEEDLDVKRSLMTELREFIIKQRQIQSDSDEEEESSEDECEAASSQ